MREGQRAVDVRCFEKLLFVKVCVCVCVCVFVRVCDRALCRLCESAVGLNNSSSHTK